MGATSTKKAKPNTRPKSPNRHLKKSGSISGLLLRAGKVVVVSAPRCSRAFRYAAINVTLFIHGCCVIVGAAGNRRLRGVMQSYPLARLIRE